MSTQGAGALPPRMAAFAEVTRLSNGEYRVSQASGLSLTMSAQEWDEACQQVAALEQEAQHDATRL